MASHGGGAPMSALLPHGGSIVVRAKMEKLTATTRDIMVRQQTENGSHEVVDDVMERLRSEGAADTAPRYQKDFAKEWFALGFELRAAEQAEKEAGGAARLAALNAQTGL